jgi:hypothetical protein
MNILLVAILLSGDVTFTRGPGRLEIAVGGAPFAVYVYEDPAIPRPYFAHVRAPGGIQVTRTHPPVEGKDATDHATVHPGIWLAFGDLGGADFWRNKGRVRHEHFVGEPAEGSFTVVNRYEAGERLICRETCRVSVRVRPGGTLLVIDSAFTAAGEGVAFGDQEEMGLGVRVATPLAVRAGGRITNSEGRQNEKGTWGREADWCDYSGKEGGLLLMPDPGNFKRCWFHARDYGVLVANPFGRKAFTKGEPSRVPLKPGEPFRLRFGVLAHGMPFDPKAAYEDFLGVLRESKKDGP